MQFTHKLLSCQKKLVNDFIHFKFCLNNCLVEFLSFNDHLFFFYHKQHDLIQALVYFVKFCDSRIFLPSIFLKTHAIPFHCFYMKQNEIFLVDSFMCLTKHFLHSSKNIKVFFVRINSIKLRSFLALLLFPFLFCAQYFFHFDYEFLSCS